MTNRIKKAMEEFLNDEIYLHDYTNIDNQINNPDYDEKLTIKLGRRIDKNLKIILQSDEGIEQFKDLLQYDNKYIRFLVARFLYPLDPQQYLKIMVEYKNEILDEFERNRIDDVIEGLKNKLPVFISQFRNWYGDNYEIYIKNLE